MALKRVRSQEGMAAQAMPPRAPATTMAGSSRLLVLFGKCRATAPAARAPTSSWPSAPMFQTLARKPTESPTAQSIRGVAFRNSSQIP